MAAQVNDMIDDTRDGQIQKKFPISTIPGRNVFATFGEFKNKKFVDVGKCRYDPINDRYNRVADKGIWLHREEFRNLMSVAPAIERFFIGTRQEPRSPSPPAQPAQPKAGTSKKAKAPAKKRAGPSRKAPKPAKQAAIEDGGDTDDSYVDSEWYELTFINFEARSPVENDEVDIGMALLVVK